jgi:hypothetical protein
MNCTFATFFIAAYARLACVKALIDVQSGPVWAWRGLRAGLGAVLAALALGIGTPAWAGRACAAPQPPKTATIERALELWQSAPWRALDQSGADVVVLARAGQDLSRYGLRYSHLGFAYRQRDALGASVWRVLHKLNQCGTAESALYRQGLGDFFLDDLWRFEAAWVVPTPEVQRKLLAAADRPGARGCACTTGPTAW